MSYKQTKEMFIEKDGVMIFNPKYVGNYVTGFSDSAITASLERPTAYFASKIKEQRKKMRLEKEQTGD